MRDGTCRVTTEFLRQRVGTVRPDDTRQRHDGILSGHHFRGQSQVTVMREQNRIFYVDKSRIPGEPGVLDVGKCLE